MMPERNDPMHWMNKKTTLEGIKAAIDLLKLELELIESTLRLFGMTQEVEVSRALWARQRIVLAMIREERKEYDRVRGKTK